MAVYAVIDLGSNTVRLLIAEAMEDHASCRWRLLLQAQDITRLGQGVYGTHRIQQSAADRTLSLLLRYSRILSDYPLKRMTVVGTQALREARNGRNFLQRVKACLGWQIRVLSPEEEARLTLLGIRSACPDLPGKLMILDIGGSSTELAMAEGSQVVGLVSLPLGAVGIQEEYIRGDPPLPDEMKGMLSSLHERIQTPSSRFSHFVDHLLVGTAGTITTLAAVQLGRIQYDPQEVSRQSLVHAWIREILDRLSRMSLEQRRGIPGLEKKRADIILAGTAILLVMMSLLGRDRIRVSDGGLLEGILIDLLERGD